MCRGVHGVGDSPRKQNGEVIIKLKKKRGGSLGRKRLSTTRQCKGHFDEASSGHSGGPAWLGRRGVGVRVEERMKKVILYCGWRVPRS